MPQTYVVTGAAGFIGSHLAERLLRDGQRVRIIDNLLTGDSSASRISHSRWVRRPVDHNRQH